MQKNAAKGRPPRRLADSKGVADPFEAGAREAADEALVSTQAALDAKQRARARGNFRRGPRNSSYKQAQKQR